MVRGEVVGRTKRSTGVADDTGLEFIVFWRRPRYRRRSSNQRCLNADVPNAILAATTFKSWKDGIALRDYMKRDAEYCCPFEHDGFGARIAVYLNRKIFRFDQRLKRSFGELAGTLLSGELTIGNLPDKQLAPIHLFERFTERSFVATSTLSLSVIRLRVALHVAMLTFMSSAVISLPMDWVLFLTSDAPGRFAWNLAQSGLASWSRILRIM